MRTIWSVAILAAALGAASSAPAQMNDTGIPTETQERLRNRTEIPWLDLLGLLGLFGLLGLRKDHADDSYHPAPLE